MACVTGAFAFDVVAVPFERVEQRGDLSGDLELVVISTQRLELGSEVAVELDSWHTAQ